MKQARQTSLCDPFREFCARITFAQLVAHIVH